MSTDAARTKLRELIATKQQWLRQWQAPELLSPGRSDMIQVLSDNIAELQQVLAELAKAEPQEPDCWCQKCNEDRTVKVGGIDVPVAATRMILCPTCGNKRCPHASDHRLACTGSNDPGQPGSVYGSPQRPAEPVQEVKGCDHCNHPLYAAVKCRVCGRVTEPTPPQRKPLSGVAIYGLFVRSGLGAYHQKDFVVQTEYDRCIERFARAIERAHGIGGEG